MTASTFIGSVWYLKETGIDLFHVQCMFISAFLHIALARQVVHCHVSSGSEYMLIDFRVWTDTVKNVAIFHPEFLWRWKKALIFVFRYGAIILCCILPTEVIVVLLVLQTPSYECFFQKDIHVPSPLLQPRVPHLAVMPSHFWKL